MPSAPLAAGATACYAVLHAALQAVMALRCRAEDKRVGAGRT